MIVKAKNQHITKLYMYAPSGLGYTKHQSGLRPLWCFVPPQLGQGSMLRIALLPAPTVIYSHTLGVIGTKLIDIKLKGIYTKHMRMKIFYKAGFFLFFIVNFLSCGTNVHMSYQTKNKLLFIEYIFIYKSILYINNNQCFHYN
jgi:hypothetical protein